MAEARDRTDKRLDVLAEQTFKVADIGLVCSGTDVRGPELAQEIQAACTEALAYIDKGDDVLSTLNGMLVRTFWLGFEYGKAEEEF